MKVSWTQGQTKERASEITKDFTSSLLIRKRLEELLTKKIDLSNAESRAKSTYDSPNWAYVQADARGYERALSDVISLIS
jgi:hypothetical protein